MDRFPSRDDSKSRHVLSQRFDDTFVMLSTPSDVRFGREMLASVLLKDRRFISEHLHHDNSVGFAYCEGMDRPSKLASPQKPLSSASST